MTTYQNIETKKDEFRKYLEKDGVIDMITKVLVGLYEEGEKPSNALDYVKKNFGSANSGASAADADEVQSLKEEIATLKAKNEDLEARLREATGGDADGE